MGKGNKTTRETFSRLIGYNFGSIIENGERYDQIYDGAFWDTETNKKQYVFGYYDRAGNFYGQYVTDYKGFREIIDCYDYPKK